MIEIYQNYLEGKLKSSGIKTKVCKTMKELQTYDNAHVGAIIVDKDRVTEQKKHKVYNVNDSPIKRIKKFSRETIINVIMGEYDASKCDGLFVKFLSEIDKGVYDPEGNYVEIEVGEAEWVSDKDSILKSKMAVQIPITFYGGIYKDYEYKPISSFVDLQKEDEESGTD